MSRLVRVIQRDGDLPGVERTHESDDVLGGIACEDGHPIPRLPNLHETRGDCLDTGVDFAAGVLGSLALSGGGVIPEADIDCVCLPCLLRAGVEHLGERGDGEVRRQADLAVVINEARNNSSEIHEWLL